MFDAYWRFAAERQAIYFKRLAGREAPWTIDPILQQFKFTNAYRASDRTSQYLIRRVIYEGDSSWTEVFFRTMLFKLFNRIQTWQLLSSNAGPPSAGSFTPSRYEQVLTEALDRGDSVYSAAYIMPPTRRADGVRKHSGHLALLETMLDAHVPDRVMEAGSLRAVYELLRSFPSLGPFLAFQFTIDLNYSPNLPFDEDSFVVAGPGAREGIGKCFESRDGWSDEDLIRWTAEHQEREFARRELLFQDLWGRPLKLIDCQNLFCEIGKYARAAHPSFTPPGGRCRIKQKFSARPLMDRAWYPPKWGINDRIQTARTDAGSVLAGAEPLERPRLVLAGIGQP